MPVRTALAAALAGILAATPIPLAAQALPPNPPRLIVAISVDQFSADLFAQYRSTFTGGLKRLSAGVVFPKGYQSHAATETCPGHSTILTGFRPQHTGIVANNWVDQSLAREDKKVYCAEDPTVPGSSSRNYTPSLHFLKVPTLGDRMKAVDPDARVISVAGKDRAALMLGGRSADSIRWWDGKVWAGLPGSTASAAIEKASADTAAGVASDRPAMALPPQCEAFSRPVLVSPQTVVGTGRFARKAGDGAAFRASPELDAATLRLAGDLAREAQLGQRGHSDLLAIGLSATDYVGHRYGTEGAEMCVQLAALDATLDTLFDRLDATGVDYLVVLTADHGGHDLPERIDEQGLTDAARVDPALMPGRLSAAIAEALKLTMPEPLILGDGPMGDMYVNAALAAPARKRVLAATLALLRAHPQVAAVFTREDLTKAPDPAGPPEYWSLRDEARASFDPERSGDFVVLLKPHITPIADPDQGYVATHGSPWDYDRRVPILFWRQGLLHYEQPLGVQTVDIMPSLAAVVGLDLPPGSVDGRCLDLIAGPATSCPAQ